MSPHELVRLRCVPRLLVLILLCALFGPAERARAQQAPVLPQVEVMSGLSLHDSFYDDLETALSADLSGRTGIYSQTEFLPHLALAEAEVTQFNNGLVAAFAATLAALALLFPGIAATILAITDLFVGLTALFCGGADLGAEITLPQERVFAISTLATDPIEWSPLPGGNGHEVLIDAAKVGVISQLVIKGYVGDPDGPCSATEKEDIKFFFENLRYRGVVTFTSTGANVVVTLVGSLPAVTTEGESSASLWSAANQVIGGQNLEQRMAEFATTTITESLEIALRHYWGPYLPHNNPSTLPDWLMDLSGTRQDTRFEENVVMAHAGTAASVGEPTYETLVSDPSNSKTRVVLRNTHSAVTDTEGENEPAEFACADPTPFVSANGTLAPNFAAEATSVDGAYHTSFKNFEHVVIGGIRSRVGMRTPYKNGSPYIVNHSFADLVPEAIGNLNYLLTDAGSPLTDPDNPVGTVPISSTQRAALLATPVAGTGNLGNTPLNQLRLKIAVCEERKTLLPYTLSSTVSDGTVSHDVLMQVTIERGSAVILTEYFDASFIGNLLLSKALPGGDSTELRTIRSYLSSLVTMGSNLDWTEVTSSTTFSAAPVSLFLRALFGDHQTPTSMADRRAFYLIEGLTGGLIERSAHGMVVLPGLDVQAYTGPHLAYEVLAQGFYGDDYELGFKFDRPALCASIQRWGQAPGLVNGTPSVLPRNRTLVIEVNWSETVPLTLMQRKNMRTDVTGTALASDDPDALVNPSRYDVGVLLTDYEPHLGNESRVVDMSGNRFGAYLSGGGRHWVAATPAGYGTLRETFFANPTEYRDVTIELRPYKGFNSTAPCEMTYPIGPVAASNGGYGEHHEDALDDVYEALLFETRFSCKGGGDCDGTRLVARWTAPLFIDCEEDSLGKDRYTFSLNEGTLRVPPTSYIFQTQPGCIGSGGGTPGQHEFDH